MISETFESEGPVERLLEIHRCEERIWLTIRERGTWEKSFQIKIQDVPEILASLEEVTSLAKHTAEAEAEAEAEAQAELEAEALELFRAAFPRLVEEHFLSTEQAELWLRVARRAREMRAEK